MPVTQHWLTFWAASALKNRLEKKVFLVKQIVDQKMAIAKKIQITTESRETFTLRIHSRDRAFGYCRDCNAKVEIVTLDQAVWMTGVHTREMLRLVDEQAIHATETEGGLFLICVNSIPREKAAVRKLR